MDNISRMDDKQIVRALKALADPKRFQMCRKLAQSGELSCSQIGEWFPLSQPTISHHIKILHDSGLLAEREDGQRRLVSLNRAFVESLVQMLPQRLAFQAVRRDARKTLRRRRE